MYRVRVRSKKEGSDSEVTAEAFIPACDLYASGFADSIILHLNDLGLFIFPTALLACTSKKPSAPARLSANVFTHSCCFVCLFQVRHLPCPCQRPPPAQTTSDKRFARALQQTKSKRTPVFNSLNNKQHKQQLEQLKQQTTQTTT